MDNFNVKYKWHYFIADTLILCLLQSFCSPFKDVPWALAIWIVLQIYSFGSSLCGQLFSTFGSLVDFCNGFILLGNEVSLMRRDINTYLSWAINPYPIDQELCWVWTQSSNQKFRSGSSQSPNSKSKSGPKNENQVSFLCSTTHHIGVTGTILLFSSSLTLLNPITTWIFK